MVPNLAKIINFRQNIEKPPDCLITSKPWEFRWADWNNRYYIQMLKTQMEKLEKQREMIRRTGNEETWNLPAHFVLKGGMAHTVRGLFY